MLCGIGISAGFQQKLQYGDIVHRAGRIDEQRGPSQIVECINFGAILEQDSGDFRLTGQGRCMQGA
jgi:hypothetical protein